MNIPKISIPKINLKEVGGKGINAVKNLPGSAKALAKDTAEFTKSSPKQAAALIGLGAVGIAAAVGIAKAVKAGVSHIAHKN